MKLAIASARQAVDNHGQKILQFEKTYADYLALFGFQTFIMPLLASYDLKQLNPDIILLTGGGDAPSEYFDSDVEVANQEDRDSLEIDLMDYALKNKIMLLGICRGMQMINGYLGGKLTRNSADIHPVGIDHKIRILGRDDESTVNSFHRDVIQFDSLSAKLKAVVLHEKHSHVEAFNGIGSPILGIQWHPERMRQDSACRHFSDLLMKRFIEGGAV